MARGPKAARLVLTEGEREARSIASGGLSPDDTRRTKPMKRMRELHYASQQLIWALRQIWNAG